jgi:hypothetical protein
MRRGCLARAKMREKDSLAAQAAANECGGMPGGGALPPDYFLSFLSFLSSGFWYLSTLLVTQSAEYCAIV